MQFLLHSQIKSKKSKQTLPSQTDIELVYNHYIQDGNNSAVTGGIGTEKLTVYSSGINLKSTFGKNTLSFKVGADVISSASTDNIDFVVSSASILDARIYINANYSRLIKKRNLTLFGGLGFSIESDYLSLSHNLGFIKNDKQDLRSFSAQIQVYNDDLRWWGLDFANYKENKLIYPKELRTQEWFTQHKRNSYNLKMSYTQVLNKYNTMGLFSELTYQQGLLSTPYHRVYMSDTPNIVVENLPQERYKLSLGLKLNSFVSGRLIFKNSLSSYIDNFGIFALTLENEVAIKVNPFFTLYPNFRIYNQKASKYFAPYKAHSNKELYYTSDYDLSSFQTFTFGIGFKYVFQKTFFKSVLLRYSFYYRSNNLSAHIASIIIQTSFFKK